MNSFNPNRLELSVLLDEYLNEVSPMTEFQISYHGTYKLVQKYIEGVSFHDVTRAVRYFSPTYMITFENYVGILKIFFDEQHNYVDKAEQSIKNILNIIINGNDKVSDEVSKIIDSLKREFNKKNFDELPIINLLNTFIKHPNNKKIPNILDKIVPKKEASKRIKVPTTTICPQDFKVHIHILDLFNIKKCISFLNIFNENCGLDEYSLSLKIGFAIECQIRNNNKFSKMVFIKTPKSNENTNNGNANMNQNDDINNDPIYYRIDDIITLDFNLDQKHDNSQKTEDNKDILKENAGYEMIMNSPLILNLYTIIIPNTIVSRPMKFLYGYIKINLVPILFAHGHEIQLSGNFIPLETQFDQSQIYLLYQNKSIPETTEDPVMLSFSLKTDIDPFICYSAPFDSKITKIDGVDIKEIREKTIMSSNSRSCQISAIEELNDIPHFLCYYVDANIQFDTDDLVDLLIRDSRKPGPNYSPIVRSPFTLYVNQFSDLSRDSEYNDVFIPPVPFKNKPDFFFDVLQEGRQNADHMQLIKNKAIKMTQLERCIILCNALIKSKIPSFVCCGSIDMCDTYCVISLSTDPLSRNKGEYLHLIPGHVYPISLLSYAIKKNDQEKRINKMKDLKLNNLFDFNFSSNGQHKDYKSVHVWCLSDVMDDAISSSFHITTIFNDTNVWINRQQNTAILRINWNMDDSQLWFPVLNNFDNDQIKQYVYSKRKVTFLDSFDKVRYEFYFNYEFERYAEEHSIRIDKHIHNLIVSNKKKLFSKPSFRDSDEPSENSESYEPSENSKSDKPNENSKSDKPNENSKSDKPSENSKSDKPSENSKSDEPSENSKSDESNKNHKKGEFYVCQKYSESSSDNDTSEPSDSTICNEFEFLKDLNEQTESQTNEEEETNESKSDEKSQIQSDTKIKSDKFFFFRKIEAPYFMMPDELLEYIIENNGLRFMNSFDIVIDFKPLPLNNCRISVIIAYNVITLAIKKSQQQTKEKKK